MQPARPLLTRRRRWRNRRPVRRRASGRSVYNYFRDAVTGRYVESDTIGVEGGVNTYGYAASNPLANIDPRGLFFTSVDAACAMDPMFCTEIMGQMVRNAADLSGDLCRQQDAEQLATALRAAGAVATVASLASMVKP